MEVLMDGSWTGQEMYVLQRTTLTIPCKLLLIRSCFEIFFIYEMLISPMLMTCCVFDWSRH